MIFMHDTECSLPCSKCKIGSSNYLEISCRDGDHWCGCENLTCLITGNLCGTDTKPQGCFCDCKNCREYEAKFDE